MLNYNANVTPANTADDITVISGRVCFMTNMTSDNESALNAFFSLPLNVAIHKLSLEHFYKI